MGDILLGQSHHPWEQGGTSITKLMVLHVHCAAVSHKLSSLVHEVSLSILITSHCPLGGVVLL